LSSAVLLVGNPMELDEVTTRLGSVTDGRTISRLLQFLADDPHWDAIAAAVTRRLLRPATASAMARPVPPHRLPPGQGHRDKMARCLLFARIDVARLHELARERANSVQHAAKVLGATVDAVRVILDEHPAPAASLTTAQARATGQVRHAARQALTEKEFRRRYIDRHHPLYDVAKQTGFSRQTLARLAAEYGIALREGPQDYKRKGVIDRDWLFEQYVGCGRTLPDLARLAHFHQIPLRPPAAARAATQHCTPSTRRPTFLTRSPTR
jgi:AraC-like DNA-binding protein